MRDLIRDAALITTARMWMESGRGVDPQDFAEMYSDSDDDRAQTLQDLNALGLAYQKYTKREVWDTRSSWYEPKYTWTWDNEE